MVKKVFRISTSLALAAATGGGSMCVSVSVFAQVGATNSAAPGNASAHLCAAPNVAAAPSNPLESATLAQKRLGQGVAYFDSGQYVLAMQQLKSAIALGFKSPTESAIANKYLAFYYCIHNVRNLCEQHLEKALTVAPPFDLESSEKGNPQWASEYRNVVRRLTSGCETPTLTAAPAASAPMISSGVATATAGRTATATPPVTSVVSSPAPPQSTGKKSKNGTIQLDIRPWGEVFVNKRSVGATPPRKELTLPAGVHQIEVRNAAGTPLRATLTLEAGDVTKISHRF
jgi:hypothetical protein